MQVTVQVLLPLANVAEHPVAAATSVCVVDVEYPNEMAVPPLTLGAVGAFICDTVVSRATALAIAVLPLIGSVAVACVMLTALVPDGGLMPLQGWLGAADL